MVSLHAWPCSYHIIMFCEPFQWVASSHISSWRHCCVVSFINTLTLIIRGLRSLLFIYSLLPKLLMWLSFNLVRCISILIITLIVHKSLLTKVHGTIYFDRAYASLIFLMVAIWNTVWRLTNSWVLYEIKGYEACSNISKENTSQAR